MKRYQFVLVLFITAVAALAVAPALAQYSPPPATAAATTPAPAAPAPGSVALINVADVFERSRTFQSEMQLLNQDIETKGAQLEQRNQALQAALAELPDMQSEARSGREIELAEEQAKIQIEQQAALRDFRIREAQIYYRTYVRIQQAINQYATHYQLGAVIRFNAQPEVNPDNPDQVLQEVNKQVLWHDMRLDITDAIQSMVNQGAPAPGPTPAPAISTNPRGSLPINY
jgi:Skp family chaperone for outer membrane proteins